MRISTPFLKGSVFELGSVRTTWEGSSNDGTNLIMSVVRCIARLNSLLAGIVNSPHLRNAENARVVDALKLSFPSSEECVTDSSIALSMSQVIRSLGFCSCSPVKHLIPWMSLWSNGDSQVANGRSVLMCAARRWVTYDLMVLGCSCFIPPSHTKHSSITVCDVGRFDLSELWNWGCMMMKSA